MTEQDVSPINARLIAAIEPLAAIDPSDRVIAPPQRVTLSEGRECLVLWQPDSVGGDWSVVLHARPADPQDAVTPVGRLAVHMPSDGAAAVYWEDADREFREFVADRFASIVEELAARQSVELANVRNRAGLSSNIARGMGSYIPHLVVLGGLAAFAYMFGIVHIK